MAVSQEEFDRRVEAFRTLCQRRGFKVTPQRLQIYREIAQTEEHPEADTIIARVREVMPTVSADTVYRTLAFLEENGLIQKLSRLHGSARFDANMRHHHHFVCTTCGAAWDFYCDDLDRFSPPAQVTRLGAVQAVHAELHGTCNDCQAAHEGVEQQND